MKNIMKFVLVLVILLSMLAVSCGEKEKAIDNENQTTQVSKDDEGTNEGNEDKSEDKEEIKEETSDYATRLKEIAKKEGVSVKELEKTLDGLAELGAETMSISKEKYIQTLEDQGSSVLDEWATTSEVMGISISELYESEKARMETRTDEEKETLAGMAEALEEIGGLDLEQVEGGEDINALLGISENNSGEIVEVGGDFKDIFYYKADEISFEYVDEYSITVEYFTKEDIDEILEYYVELLGQTKDYMLIAVPGEAGGMLSGTFNDMLVYVEIVDNESGQTRVTCYLDYTSKK